MFQVKESSRQHTLPTISAHRPITELGPGAGLEQEIDAMIRAVDMLDPGLPDLVMMTCMALMARCTEIYVQLTRMEVRERRAKLIRTTQLQKLMDLIEFYFKGASRLIEVRRQDVEMSR